MNSEKVALKSAKLLANPLRDPCHDYWQICDQTLADLKTKFGSLNPGVSCGLHASYQAAIFDWIQLLIERNREVGSSKSIVVLSDHQFPFFSQLKAFLLSKEFVVKSSSEFSSGGVPTEQVLAAILLKENPLLQTEMSASEIDGINRVCLAQKIPVFEVSWNTKIKLPKQTEVFVFSNHLGGCLTLLGERIRLTSASAPYGLWPAQLTEIKDFVERQLKDDSSEVSAEMTRFKSAVLTNSDLLIKRETHHAVLLQSKTKDSKFIFDQLNAKLALSDEWQKKKLRAGVVPYSLCDDGFGVGDLRTESYLLAQGWSEQEIRGSILITANVIDIFADSLSEFFKNL